MFDYDKAIKLQSVLSHKVLKEIEKTPQVLNPRFVLALDSSYAGDSQIAVGVLYDMEARAYAWRGYAIAKPPIPYIPGLLAFREAPGYIRVVKKCPVKPDLLLVDGHGLTHPRAFGIASHIGLVLDTPSIGVAKKFLFGDITKVGERELIFIRGKPAGEILRTSEGRIYVSIGYKVRLDDAVRIVKALIAPGSKLPKPLHEADRYSKELRNRLKRL